MLGRHLQSRFTLTISQTDIYFDQVKHINNPLYNIGGYIQLGAINEAILSLAHQALIDSVDVFGLRVSIDQTHQTTGIYQTISDKKSAELALIDFSHLSESDAVTCADNWLNERFSQGIEYIDTELYQCYLIKLSADNYRYVWLAHHLLNDGWGFSNLCQRLSQFYQYFATAPLQKPEQKIEQKSKFSHAQCLQQAQQDLAHLQQHNWQDVALSDEDYLNSAKFEKDLAFWTQQPGIAQKQLFEPYYRSQLSAGQSKTSLRHIHYFQPDMAVKVNKLAKVLGVNDSHIYLGLISVYFSLAYNRKQIRIGLPVHNRRNRLQKQMIGVFTGINPLVLDFSQLSENHFAALAEYISQRQKAGFRHQRCGIGSVINALANDSQAKALGFVQGQTPYDVAFNFLALTDPLIFAGQNSPLVYLSHNHESLPLKINLWQGSGEQPTQLQIDFNLSYFNLSEVKQMAARFEHILEQVLLNAHIQLSDISLLSKVERQQLIAPVNQLLQGSELADQTANNATIVSGFMAQVTNSPSKLAVSVGDGQSHALSYEALNLCANQIADGLIQAGVKQGQKVALGLGRDCYTLAAVLAVLKTGAAYVPLDNNYPLERLAFMLEDSGAQVILTTQVLAGDFEQLAAIDGDTSRVCLLIEDLLKEHSSKSADFAWLHQNINITPDDVAYLIYTSGSTGRPKGVEVRHRNVTALIEWALDCYTDNQLSKVLCSTSLNFDISVFELFVPLWAGGQCVMVKNALSLIAHKIDISLINTVPSAGLALLEHQAIEPCVEVINFAGEALPASTINDIFATTKVRQVYNLYGPSEDTVYSTFKRFVGAVKHQVSIGKAIKGTHCYVVSSQGSPLTLLPSGLVGELYLTGAGVSKGYINQQSQSQQSFIKDPFNADNPYLVYKTGDLVRQLSNGDLAFLGRADQQIKVRGFRIEPGEIEERLKNHQLVKDAAVLAVSANENTDDMAQSLCAFLLFNSQHASVTSSNTDDVAMVFVEQSIKAQLNDYVAQALPPHMVPAHLISLQTMPLTGSGKVDKLALKAQFADLITVSDHVATKTIQLTAEQQKVAAIWATLVHVPVEQIKPSDHFFDLGGDSLKAVSLLGQLNQAFNANLSLEQVFAATSLSSLANMADSSSASAGENSFSGQALIEVTRDKQANWPLSFSQQRLWTAQHTSAIAGIYNMCAAFKVVGQLDLPRLTATFKDIIAHQQILHTVYRSGRQGLTQHALDQYEFTIEHFTVANQSALDAGIEQFALADFDLSQDLMLKVACFAQASDDQNSEQQNSQTLVIKLHHIAADAWSIGVLVRLLQNGYAQGSSQLLQNKKASAENAIQYADYAIWQKELAAISPSVYQQQLDYWAEQLAGIPAQHALVLDNSRNTQRGAVCDEVEFKLAKSQLVELKKMANKRQMTLFMLLHGAFALLLSRHSGQNDIVIGTAVANRHNAQLDDLLGFFVNTLVLRADCTDRSLEQYLLSIKQLNLAALAAQQLPFELLLEHLIEKGLLVVDSTINPLFQIMLTLGDDSGQTIDLASAQLKQLPGPKLPAKFDINLVATITADDELLFSWQFDSQLFSQQRISHMAQQLGQLLTSFIQADNCAEKNSMNIRQLDWLTAAQYQYLCVDLNQAAIPNPQHFNHPANSKSLFGLFRYYVENTPDNFAVADVINGKRQALTYGQLGTQVNALAYQLSAADVSEGDLVGVCIERSIDTVAAIFAVLNLGAAYIPMDTELPANRLLQMIADSQTTTVIVNADSKKVLLEAFADSKVSAHSPQQVATLPNLLIAEKAESQQVLAPFPQATVEQHSPAYMIYTSGSTGKPKGVLCRHYSVINLLQDFQQRKAVACGDVGSLWANFSFDVSVLELFGSLCFGAGVEIIPTEYRGDSHSLLDYLQLRHVNHGYIPPFALKQLRQNLLDGQVYDFKRIVVGVEPIAHQLLIDIQQQLPAMQIINGYGPSETTVCSALYNINTHQLGSCAKVKAGDTNSSEITPIGTAPANTSLWVLDDDLQLCPFGAVGELYIGGDGLALGYYRRADLTEQRFIVNPHNQVEFFDHPKIYKTGDLVRFNRDGQLVFVARQDDQIKLRGYRIESGEICAQCAALDDVQEAHLLVKGEGDGRFLAAYIQSNSDSDELIYRLTEHLIQHLPHYMVPARFVVMAKLPQLKNGKIDKTALAAIELNDKLITLPRDGQEQQLSEIWQQLLGLEQLDVLENLFSLGANSLLGARFVHLVADKCNFSISVKQLYDNPTIAQLAKVAVNGQGQLHTTKAPDQNKGILSASQFRLWLAEQVHKHSNQNNIAGVISLTGKLDKQLLKMTFGQLMAKHAMLRAQIVVDSGEPYLTLLTVEQGINNLDLVFEQSLGQISAGRMKQHNSQVIDITNGPLFKVLVLQISETQWQIGFVFHHLIFDGWSMSIFSADFFFTYQNLAKHQDSIDSLTPYIDDIAPSYIDYAYQQKLWLESEHSDEAKHFWRDYLAGVSAPSKLVLPICTSSLSPKASTQDVSTQLHIGEFLSAELTAKLSHYATVQQGTLYQLMLATLALLIARTSGESDVVVGSAVANREQAKWANIVGTFVNNLPIRSEVDLDKPFDKWFKQVQGNYRNALAYQALPYQQIEQAAQLSGVNLFNVFFNFLQLPKTDMANDYFQGQLEQGMLLDSKFDLTLYMSQSEHGDISVDLHYRPQLFKASQLNLWLNQWQRILSQLVVAPDTRCGDFDLNSPVVDKQKPLHCQWQGPVYRQFDDFAARPAIVSKEVSLTYSQLQSASDYFAEQLLAKGIKAQDVVVLFAKRDARLPVLLLAILKIGAVFSLFQHQQSLNQKTKNQLASCNGKLVIDFGDKLDSTDVVSGTPIWHLDQPSELNQLNQLNQHSLFNLHLLKPSAQFVASDLPQPKANDLAYLAFTSGSSGEAKVIKGNLASLNVYAQSLAKAAQLSQSQRFAMLSSLTHDPLLRDIFIPLELGACLYIPDSQAYEFGQMIPFLQTHNIEVANLTPSMAEYLLQVAPVAGQSINSANVGLKKLFLGGEPIVAQSIKACRDKMPQGDIYGLYGATETARALAMTQLIDDGQSVSGERFSDNGLGQGIAGVQLLVLNNNHQLCAIGELGQIAIRAEYLSLGYSDEQLTSDVFIQLSEQDSALCYLTGDLGRFDDKGNVHFARRNDRQLKIRGFRVEPAEIEHALEQLPTVEQARVSLVGAECDSSGRLVAFVIVNDKQDLLQLEQMQTLLSQALPSYLVPEQLCFVDTWPLNANGKLDVHQLAELAQHCAQTDTALLAAKTDTEHKVLQIWQQLLVKQQIGCNQNFFNIGGHSLLATRFFVRVTEQFKVSLSYQDLFENPTIELISAQIDKRLMALSVSSVQQAKPKKKKVSI